MSRISRRFVFSVSERRHSCLQHRKCSKKKNHDSLWCVGLRPHHRFREIPRTVLAFWLIPRSSCGMSVCGVESRWPCAMRFRTGKTDSSKQTVAGDDFRHHLCLLVASLPLHAAHQLINRWRWWGNTLGHLLSECRWLQESRQSVS